MKNLIKNLGIILVLIGVIFFVIYSQTVGVHNALLLIGLLCEIIGFFAHLLINKYVK